MPNRKSGYSYRFQKAWSWPGSVEDFLSNFLVSPSLHACCGESKLGDVRVDLFTECDVRADIFHLPFRDDVFNTVLMDPPWNMPYNLRPRVVFEAKRVLREGGRLIFNAPWWPNAEGLYVREVWFAKPKAYRNCPLFIIAEKQSQRDKTDYI